MIVARLHRKGGEVILAACDSSVSGRKLEEDDVCMDTGSGFFAGDEVSEDEFRGMLVQATSAYLVGERAVALAVDAGCVHPDACSEVCGVPYALFFSMG